MIAIASPYRGLDEHNDRAHNLEVAGRIRTRYFLRGVPAISLVLQTSPLGEVPPCEHAIHNQAKALCREIINRADEVHFYIPTGAGLSSGMIEELVYCQQIDKPYQLFNEEWE